PISAPRATSTCLHAAPLSATCSYSQLSISTGTGITLHDITDDIKAAITSAGVKDGSVTIFSRHTTTAVTINEMESRLVDDLKTWLLELAPPEKPYLHNDLHLRSGPKDWPGGDEAWRAQEPINAHSHLLSMMLGNSESIPVVDGKLMMGTWQSVILVELDGPRDRGVGIQVC
ncbi:unnamed protein product, partial [Chrysoparadoxa australica]